MSSIFRRLFAFAAVLAGVCASCTQHERLEPARSDFTPRAPRSTLRAGASPIGAAVRSGGCGVAGKQTGDFHLSTRDGNGVARDFEILVPASYSPSTPLAVSFVFHGGGATSADAKAFGLQDAAGASSASIFVFPQGINGGWDDTCSGYDMPFFDNMLATLEANYCLDTTRVFVAGFSWGGDQVTALACCRGDRIRGIAAASCSDEFANPASYQSYKDLPCPVSNAPAIRFTHATDGDPALPSPLFASTSALYRSFEGCTATATATSPSPCLAYAGCKHPFVECAYPALGHSLPQDWGQDSWAFFTGLSAVSSPTPVPALTLPILGGLGLLLLMAALIALRAKKDEPA